MKVYEQLFDHIDQYWIDRIKKYYTWQLGPISQTLPNFSILCVEPSTADESWVYVTHGAWEVECGTNPRKEFVMAAPASNARHIETLSMLANFHADARYRLEVGKTINIGHGWVEGSVCDHLLISLPYPYGPRLECCNVDGMLVQYLWALPITAKEAEFARKSGLEALEERLDSIGIDFLDPDRASVV